jgi:uncharacterized protein
VDPMRVLEQSQHLTLAARIGGFRLAVLDDLLYSQRRLVEVVARNRYIVPVEDYPVFRVRMAEIERANRPRLTELEPLMQRALKRIEAEGSLSSLDFGETDRADGWWVSDGRAIRQALEWLWHFGRVAVSHRIGTRRYFDLPERLFGEQAAMPRYEAGGGGSGSTVSAAQLQHMRDRLMSKYFRAMGLVDARDWAFGWGRYKATDKRTLLKQLVADGSVVPVGIEGVKTIYYALSADAEDLTAAADLDLAPDLHILPPLDNLIWLRSRTSDVFGFDYTWEAYVPAVKRNYGPYTCPLLCGDSLVGRIDAAVDRQACRLVVNGLWWEPGVPRPDDALLQTCLDRLTAVCCPAV